jgi:hypothetical protein
MSYRDRLDFGLVGDRDQIDDLWPLMRGLEKALDEMEEMVCGTPPAAQPAPSSERSSEPVRSPGV